MVDIGQVVVGGLLALIGAWAAYRLSTVARAAVAVAGASPEPPTGVVDGETVTVEGEVFVEDTPVAADRLFGDREVGAYVWRARFLSDGYDYDSDRGELRRQRSTFASGVESGRFGVTSDGRDVYVDLSWLDRAYGSPALADLEVGNPVRNASLPFFLTRYVWDAPYVHLDGTLGESPADRLTDVFELYRSDVRAEEFSVDARGVPADGRLFAHGEVRIEDGDPVLTGGDGTPLVLSDRGRDGLVRALGWRAARYGLALAAAGGLLAWVVV